MFNVFKKKGSVSYSTIIIIYALYIVVALNYAFFSNTYAVYREISPLFICSIFIVLFAISVLFLSLITYKYIYKVLYIVILLISSGTAYFMNTYGTFIDSSMIENIAQTNISEAGDLFSFKLVIYIFFLGIVPSFVLLKLKVKSRGVVRHILSRVVLIVLSIIVIVASFFISSKSYTTFVRSHKTLRYSINPYFWIYSTGQYVYKTYFYTKPVAKPIALDAKLASTTKEHKIMIVVVGETARYDRWSLNGYKRDTNPLLSKESGVISLDMYSCGTFTAYSVPCIFSKFGRTDFSQRKGMSNQSVLDVLNRLGIAVLWRDNNSSSKGVADRVTYEDYRGKLNSVHTDGEARDTGMLVGLGKYLNKNSNRDNIIILHSMGSHGPAYYKRYPRRFAKFKPECKSNQLSSCGREKIDNAYDDTVLYSDYFLDQTIKFLKRYEKDHIVALIYFGDHGESLGEGGIYLHGMPYFMAPKEQKHVASIVWVGSSAKMKFIDTKRISSDKKYSQDYIFHTILGFFQVKTKLYNPNLDILKYKK